ncbi:hypothetical protein K7711_36680 [Nocardia sp. CA2R105]|uniref:MAB_1171c family putative transporter n=1 Tax=Nocardia coffeae TaxID=2873381 RepID=UPI001CA7905C|nr:MAB_1171c family putative transporter [Nocardia coffeae]MBY8862061.1 hypothetical protein [Nocardia coffeae]
MIALRILEWIAILALLWVVALVARRPNNVQLWWVAGVVGCWTTGIPSVIRASGGHRHLGLDPMTVQVIGHTLMMSGAYCLGCFYCFVAFDTHSATVRATRRGLVLIAVVLTVTVAAWRMPVGVRTDAAMLTAVEHTELVRGVSSIGVFYTSANLYLLYAFSTAAVSTRRSARYAAGALRRALATTTAGLITLTAGFGIFALASSVRWAGANLPNPIRKLGVLLLLPGFGLYLIGITMPATGTGIAAARIWWIHRRDYHTLAPLWSALNTQFPEDAFIPTRFPDGSLLDRLGFSDVHRRWYRRVIECRDGLVRISPYIARIQARDAQSPSTSSKLAHQLRRALDDRAAGVAVPEDAVPIATPTTDGLDADVEVLLALAIALGEQAHDRTCTVKGTTPR